jgi:amino-acid N-acetyltransferase
MIRKATPDDIPTLQIFIAQFVQSGDVLPRTIPELETLLNTCFVAEHEGAIIGMAILEIYSWKLAEIRSLAVAEQARGFGYGRALVDACLQLAQERNVREVMAITRSEKFFETCGFTYTLPNLRKALFYEITPIHQDHETNDTSG